MPVKPRSKVEKPPRRRAWRRDENGRLARDQLQGRPNLGDGKDLEVFWHVDRRVGSEVLPPPQTLWRQQKGRANQIRYVPLWIEVEQRLAVPQRRSSLTVNIPNGVPYLYSYDTKTTALDRRWRPYHIVANGGFGVVITYIDDSLPLDEDLEIPDDQLRVAKFNYKGGDLVEILRPVVVDFSHRAKTVMGSLGGPGRVFRRPPPGQFYHCKTVTDSIVPARRRHRPSAEGMFSQESTILELLKMTGTPHVPAMWKVADPPQDGTLLTLEYIPGGKTLDEHLDFFDNEKVYIKRIWEATLCIAKAMSAMAYGSEDPAPSHRVYGWNEIVHVDWTPPNIFVMDDCPGHTCAHGACYKVGDFGFAIILPYKPDSRVQFRNGELQSPWYANLCPAELPEANWDRDQPNETLRDDPIAGRFSHKTNVFLMANMWNSSIPGTEIGKTGILRYEHDDLTTREKAQLKIDIIKQLPLAERLTNGSPDESGDPTSVRPRGFVDVAESLMRRKVATSLRVSEQRYVQVMRQCLEIDPSKRPEIEEIMLQAAQGIAEAGDG